MPKGVYVRNPLVPRRRRPGCAKCEGRPAIRHGNCTPASRFDFFVKKVPGGCWEWTGCRDKGHGKGYGLMGFNVRAHRYSYERFVGPIPRGMLVLHSCDNPGCVNPEHLRVGTDADNMRDRDSRGHHARGSKTHCPHGHEYAGKNLAIVGGYRKCRACMHRNSRNHYVKKMAALRSPSRPDGAAPDKEGEKA